MTQPVPELLCEETDGLAILTLNRPDKLNSLTVALFEALLEQVERIEQSTDTIGAVLLRGAGRCFSAGHDLNDIAAGEKPRRAHLQAHTIERLANLPQPVITAVHGHCYTGALELALAGDIILASSNARIGDTHAKWALSPVWGLSQRLPRRIGQAKAQEMMFTCRTYSGEQAAAMGLANACYPDESFDAEVERFAREILANSWHINFGNKRLLRETANLPLAAGLAHEIYHTPGRGPDAEDRVRAFTSRKKG